MGRCLAQAGAALVPCTHHCCNINRLQVGPPPCSAWWPSPQGSSGAAAAVQHASRLGTVSTVCAAPTAAADQSAEVWVPQLAWPGRQAATVALAAQQSCSTSAACTTCWACGRALLMQWCWQRRASGRCGLVGCCGWRGCGTGNGNPARQPAAAGGAGQHSRRSRGRQRIGTAHHVIFDCMPSACVSRFNCPATLQLFF